MLHIAKFEQYGEKSPEFMLQSFVQYYHLDHSDIINVQKTDTGYVLFYWQDLPK